MEQFYIITFDTTNFAMQGEAILKKNNIPQQIIPTPRQITLSCGLSIKFDKQYFDNVYEIIKSDQIKSKAVYAISGGIKERKIEIVII